MLAERVCSEQGKVKYLTRSFAKQIGGSKHPTQVESNVFVLCFAQNMLEDIHKLFGGMVQRVYVLL